jgi:hypothetical protein
MAKVILDWDEKYKTAVIVSEFLPAIRARFSIPNDSKAILKKQGRATWYMADFISPITNGGRFEVGLYFELINFLTHDNVSYEIITTELLESQIIQTYPWNSQYTISALNMELRPYQATAVRKSIHMGYGVVIVGTAGGKTLIMASLIQTIRSKNPNFTTLVILPSNLLQQTYKEFLSYGMDESLLSMWGGEDTFEKKPIMLASIEIMRACLTTFSERKPKLESSWTPEYECHVTVNYKPCKGKCRFGYSKEICVHRVSVMKSYKQYLDEFTLTEKARKKAWNDRRKSYLNQLASVDLVLLDECLRSGQKITTPHGACNIEDIKDGDMVLSYNVNTNQSEYKRVLKTYKNIFKSVSHDKFIEITIESGDTLMVTPNHKIYTDRGLIRADNLTMDDNIITIT